MFLFLTKKCFLHNILKKPKSGEYILRKHYSIRKKSPLVLPWLIFLVFTILGAFLYLSGHVKPIIHTLADNQSRINAQEAVNTAVAKELTEENIKYDNLVKIKTNDKGEVTSLTTNIVKVNNMKAQISKRIADELKEADAKNTSIKVPIGTLIGFQLTSGKGFKIGFGMTSRSYVRAEIKNDFKQAGINQTLHRLMLNVNVKITSIFAGHNVYSEVSSNFCVAETVIVGVVPEAFTDIVDSDNSKADQIFDYVG